MIHKATGLTYYILVEVSIWILTLICSSLSIHLDDDNEMKMKNVNQLI